jgi:hypothetical protein
MAEDSSPGRDLNRVVAKDLSISSWVWSLAALWPQLAVLRGNRPHGRRPMASWARASSLQAPASWHRSRGRNDCHRHRPASGPSRCILVILLEVSDLLTSHCHSPCSAPVRLLVCSALQHQYLSRPHFQSALSCYWPQPPLAFLLCYLAICPTDAKPVYCSGSLCGTSEHTTAV